MTDGKLTGRILTASGMLLASVAFFAHRPASAVPAFAEQTGQACASCHVGGFGPQLTPFGRQFKLSGYTLRTKPFNVPLSAMAVASYVHTQRAQDEPPTEDAKRNNNASFDEGSIFLAGGVGSHLGGFAQITYSGPDEAWAWDNLDLRAVGTGKIGGKDLIYGLTLNNNPTIQDAWNTLPGWGFPYTDSDYAPGAATSPLISGGLGQAVLGLSAYAWLDSKFYLEAGGYSTPSRGTLHWLGSDPNDPGKIHGLAPYGRAAFQTDVAGGTFEAGAFALKAALYPGRDRSSGYTDRYTDLGLDASWIKPLKSDTLTLNAHYTHEKQSLNATCTLGMAEGSIEPGPLPQCADNTLNEERIDGSYYWHNAVGGTISAFNLSGSSNPFIYADNRTFRPNSSGFLFQLDGTPWGRGKSPLGPRFNMRVGAQYTVYTRFDGARFNFNGTDRNASNNNTLRVFTWVAF
ncbi:MAG: hypothetical protein ABI454_09480 [Sphingomicrobium sp.]